MIFAHTIKNVLNGTKTQTRRLCYAADTLGHTKVRGETRVAVLDGYSTAVKPRPRWIVGNTYSVQPERCHASKGRILVCDLRREDDPTQISDADARAEGFVDAADFVKAWKSLHVKKPVQPVWVITFTLVHPPARAAMGSEVADA
jgi:hypothetical protein